MQIHIEHILNGSMEGKIVWICDYRRPDLCKEPIRARMPTKVMVMNGRVVHSDYHFKRLNNCSTPTGPAILPFDKTGWRGFTGEPVKVFDNVDECLIQWNADLHVVERALHQKRKDLVDDIDLVLKQLL